MSPWRRIWLVAAREVRERARGRMYILSTIVVVLAAGGMVVAAEFLPNLIELGERELAVTADVPADLREQLPRAAEEVAVEVDLRPVASAGAGRDLLEAGEVDAVLVDEDTLLFQSERDESLAAVVVRARYLADLPGILDDLGLTQEEAQRLLQPPQVSVEVVEAEEPEAEVDDLGPRIAVSSAAVIVLYIALAFYGTWILTGVVEEKTSQVVEVLLGTLRPAELLTGKVLGILLLALAQLVAAFASLLVALIATGYEIPTVAADVAAVGVAAFVLGLLLYAFAYAALGATANRLADANSLAAPLTIVLLVPYFIGLTIVPEDPDGALAVVLSLVPFTAPLVMPARVALDAAAGWEVAVAGLLMFPAIAAMAWLSGRIYAGVILSGRRVGLREMFRSVVGAGVRQ